MDGDNPLPGPADTNKVIQRITRSATTALVVILTAIGIWQFPGASKSGKPTETTQHQGSTKNTAQLPSPTTTPTATTSAGKASPAAKPGDNKSAAVTAKSGQAGTAGQTKTESGVKPKTVRTPAQLNRTPQTKPQPPPAAEAKASPALISKVKLRNQDGDVIYEGPIDLQPTLDRIDQGERHRHRNDGSVFQNREGKLPRKPNGYYHEFVVPTPRENGPGPQRLILGEAGEVFYTYDHYKSFQRLNLKFIPQKPLSDS